MSIIVPSEEYGSSIGEPEIVVSQISKAVKGKGNDRLFGLHAICVLLLEILDIRSLIEQRYSKVLNVVEFADLHGAMENESGITACFDCFRAVDG